MTPTYAEDIQQRINRDCLLVQSPDPTRALLAEGRAQGLTEALRVFREHAQRNKKRSKLCRHGSP